MEPERIELSVKERERLKVLQQVEEGHLKQIEAARRLHLTDRQVRRLQVRLRAEGDGGIVHRLRGRRSNRQIGPACHLIALIDDASSRVWGRLVQHDSTAENLRTLGGWLERYGRPLARCVCSRSPTWSRPTVFWR